MRARSGLLSVGADRASGPRSHPTSRARGAAGSCQGRSAVPAPRTPPVRPRRRAALRNSSASAGPASEPARQDPEAGSSAAWTGWEQRRSFGNLRGFDEAGECAGQRVVLEVGDVHPVREVRHNLDVRDDLGEPVAASSPGIGHPRHRPGARCAWPRTSSRARRRRPSNRPPPARRRPSAGGRPTWHGCATPAVTAFGRPRTLLRVSWIETRLSGTPRSGTSCVNPCIMCRRCSPEVVLISRCTSPKTKSCSSDSGPCQDCRRPGQRRSC